MKIVKPRILSGFMELLPEDQLEFNKMYDTIRRVYEQFGFAPIETPAIELAEVLFAKGGGETEKQIYRFKKGDNDLALHFDLTVPLARYVAQHEHELVFPFRRYQMQKVWRGERAGAGRFREFYQCDIDVIGTNNVLVDAEIPSVIYEVFRQLG
ncbi:histidine--tRNA ligase, partial [Candidatus Saccharibacteria bacterium]|nr:histidine--tRNA ligase [Candidatus Saccharibacteria bacterium]